MTRPFFAPRTRFFSRSLRSFLCLALLSLGSCSKSCKNGNQALSEDLDLVPSNTSVINVIHVQKILQSHIGIELAKIKSQDPVLQTKYEEFVKKCGIDPLKNVDVIFNAWGPRIEKDPTDGLMILRGKFSEKEVLACLDAYKEDVGSRVSADSHGYTVHELREADGKAKVSYVLPTGKDLIIIGKRSEVEQSLSIRDKKVNSAKTYQLLNQLMTRASTSDPAMFGVMIVSDEQAQKVKNLVNRSVALDTSLKSVSWSLVSKENAEFKLQLDMANQDESTKAAQVTNQQLDELKKLPQLQMLGFTSFINLIRVEAKKESVVVDININQSQIDDLKTRLIGIKNLKE